METVKFRAWDGLRMTTSGIMFNTTNGEIFTAQNMPFMQFTGLSDKQGKEMYEGDVVKFLYYRKETIAPIIWGIDGWWASLPGWFKDLYWVADKCEVIGNIYQNPELLQEKS